MSDKKEPEKKKKSKVPVWFVRGVSIELRAEVAAAAERAGMNIGTWVARALRAALERPEGQGGARVGQGDAGDLAERVADLAATVEVVRALFEKHRRQDFPSVVERIERLEAHVPPAIPGRQGRQGSAADAVEPVEGAEMPKAARTHSRASGGAGRRPPRPWTDSDDAELRRIFDRGGTQAEAVREMSRPNSVISRKWAVLLQERAERTLPPLEQVRRVTEMQKDGTPDIEIAAFLKGEPKEPDGQGS